MTAPPERPKSERIVGVALWWGNTWSLSHGLGSDHAALIAEASRRDAEGFAMMRRNGGLQQGFVTNTGRLVSREEAREIVVANGQCPEPPHMTKLFSEDLW